MEEKIRESTEMWIESDKILDNLLAFYRFRHKEMPGVKLTDNSNLFKYESINPELDIHAFNRVVYCNTHPEGLKILIKNFKSKSSVFWTPPESKPDNIREILKDAGYTLILDCPSMIMNLADLNYPMNSFSDKLKIIEVANHKISADFTKIFNQEYDRKPAMGNLLNIRFEETMNPGSPWKRWVGYIGSKPVTIATSFTENNIVGIYSVSTLPEFRGRGFGTVMTVIPLLVAREAGIPTAVLQATDDSAGIYKKLGFAEICKYGFWLKR